MGGYGGFVWPAYGITAIVMIVLLAASLRALRRGAAELAALEREGAAPRRGRAARDRLAERRG